MSFHDLNAKYNAYHNYWNCKLTAPVRYEMYWYQWCHLLRGWNVTIRPFFAFCLTASASVWPPFYSTRSTFPWNKGNRNQIFVALDKCYPFRVPSLELCILLTALLNAVSSWINHKTRNRTSSLLFTAMKYIRHPFGPLDANDRFPATLSYTYFN